VEKTGMPSKALNIIVNRTAEHGHWIAKVKKSGGEVTVVFRQREEKADFSTRFLYAIRGYKAAGQLSGKYLAAMNLNHQNLPRIPNITHKERTKSKPTNDQIDQKLKAASDKQDKNETIQSPTVNGLFITSTNEFSSIKVTIKDEYKEQQREEKRQLFLNYIFDAVESKTGQPLSDGEKNHYRKELMPVTDVVLKCFDRAQWKDDDLRFARIALTSLAKKAGFEEKNKKWIDNLLDSLPV
jgi:hypothetical protein